MASITDVTARLFAMPLDEILVDAKHGDHSQFHLVIATVTLSDGHRVYLQWWARWPRNGGDDHP